MYISLKSVHFDSVKLLMYLGQCICISTKGNLQKIASNSSISADIEYYRREKRGRHS